MKTFRKDFSILSDASPDRMHRFFQLTLLIGFIQLITGEDEMKVYHKPGSSVHFPGVGNDQQKDAEFFRWEMSSENTKNGTKAKVLQFHAGNAQPSLMKKYKGRLDFSPSNGSFVLHHLTHSDEGLYTLSINLKNIAVQTIQLRIIDELLSASILSNSSSLDSTIALTCDVSGQLHTYQWQKDGGEISQHHQLINGNRSLIIPNAKKNDCGTYTCIACNPVSFIHAHYTLTIYGIFPEQTVIIVTSLLGLIFSAASCIGLMVLCCSKSQSTQAPLKYEKYLFLSLFSSNTVALVAIFIALASWIAIKGAAFVAGVALCFVSILLLLAVVTTVSIWNLGCLCIMTFLKKKGFRASLDVSGILCSFIVLVISIVILKEEIQLNNQGCHITYLTWSILGPLLIIFVVAFPVVAAICYRSKEDRDSCAGNQDAEEAGRELQERNPLQPNQEPTTSEPSENGHNDK